VAIRANFLESGINNRPLDRRSAIYPPGEELWKDGNGAIHSYWIRNILRKTGNSDGTSGESYWVRHVFWGNIGWNYAKDKPVEGKGIEKRPFVIATFTQPERNHPYGAWDEFKDLRIVKRFRLYNPDPYQPLEKAGWKLINRMIFMDVEIPESQYNPNDPKHYEKDGKYYYRMSGPDNKPIPILEQVYEKNPRELKTMLDWDYRFYLPCICVIKRIYGQAYYDMTAMEEENFISNIVQDRLSDEAVTETTRTTNPTDFMKSTAGVLKNMFDPVNHDVINLSAENRDIRLASVRRWNSIDSPDFPGAPWKTGRTNGGNSPSIWYTHWGDTSGHGHTADVWMFMPDRLYERPPSPSAVKDHQDMCETMEKNGLPPMITPELKAQVIFKNLEIGDPNPMYPKPPRNSGHFRFRRKFLGRYNWIQNPVSYQGVNENPRGYYRWYNSYVAEHFNWSKWKYAPLDGTGGTPNVLDEMISWLPFDVTSGDLSWRFDQYDQAYQWICNHSWTGVNTIFGYGWVWNPNTESYYWGRIDQEYRDPWIKNPTFRRRITSVNSSGEVVSNITETVMGRREFTPSQTPTSVNLWSPGTRPPWAPIRIYNNEPITMDPAPYGTPQIIPPGYVSYSYFDPVSRIHYGPPLPITKNYSISWLKGSGWQNTVYPTESWWARINFQGVDYDVNFVFTYNSSTVAQTPPPNTPAPPGFVWAWRNTSDDPDEEDYWEWILVPEPAVPDPPGP